MVVVVPLNSQVGKFWKFDNRTKSFGNSMGKQGQEKQVKIVCSI